MPGTPPGCRLTAGRDKRSSMETGKVHQPSLSAALSLHRMFPLHLHEFASRVSPNSIKITTSCYPVPSICCHDLVYDWFESLAQCLHWNVRKRQARLADASDSSDTENWICRRRERHFSAQQLSEWKHGSLGDELEVTSKHFLDRNTGLWEREHVCLQPNDCFISPVNSMCTVFYTRERYIPVQTQSVVSLQEESMFSPRN